MELSFKPVTITNWIDLEVLFESKGGPKYCWCMVWRNMIEGTDRSDKVARKASLKNYTDNKIPVGILCYTESKPIAWCSIAPRESYRNLSGDNTISGVWSLVCFFIVRQYRKQGLKELIINEAINYARTNGAEWIEAYPVDANSPSYRFMGQKPAFEKLGFVFKHKTGLRRNVMTLKV